MSKRHDCEKNVIVEYVSGIDIWKRFDVQYIHLRQSQFIKYCIKSFMECNWFGDVLIVFIFARHTFLLNTFFQKFWTFSFQALLYHQFTL